MNIKSFCRILSALLALLIMSGCATYTGSPVPTGKPSAVSSSPSSKHQNAPTAEPTFIDGQLRGMWFPYYELDEMYKSKQGFAASFNEALDRCLKYGINNVYVHVRSHCDAYYKSELFPWSAYLTGTQGVDPQIDPLQIMIDAAHSKGIKIHAWINPYRVYLMPTDLSLLADNNPAKIWLTDDDVTNDSWVAEWEGGLYLSPAEVQVTELIAAGVREIVTNYDVDGIHFDDYFYPTTEEVFDEAQYALYRTQVSGVPLELEQWRRANVNAMVSTVYNAVKAIKPDCIFGISPMASIENNYYTVYADIAAWLEGGYVDYVMPQLYFGFEYPQEKSRFDVLLKEWCELFKTTNAKLYIGLGAYRIGATDQDNIEWSEKDDILARQAELINKSPQVSGWVMYSYSSFFAAAELNAAQRQNFIHSAKTIQNDGE